MNKWLLKRNMVYISKTAHYHNNKFIHYINNTNEFSFNVSIKMDSALAFVFVTSGFAITECVLSLSVYRSHTTVWL